MRAGRPSPSAGCERRHQTIPHPTRHTPVALRGCCYWDNQVTLPAFIVCVVTRNILLSVAARADHSSRPLRPRRFPGGDKHCDQRQPTEKKAGDSPSPIVEVFTCGNCRTEERTQNPADEPCHDKNRSPVRCGIDTAHDLPLRPARPQPQLNESNAAGYRSDR